MIGLFKQEFKSLIKSPAALSILIIPIVLLIGIGFLLPSAWIIPSSITIGIVATVLLYFGGSIEEIKRTSFMKSISLTKLSKGTYLATKILFSVFISMFIIMWVLFFGWTFTNLGLLADDFSVIIPEDTDTVGFSVMNFIRNIKFEVQWDQIDWLVMFYAGAITIVVSTSLAFLFVTFSNSSLSFYLMSFGYLLAMILFGGIIMPSFLISDDNSGFKILYYLIPNYYTNNEMASSFGSTMGATIHGATDELNSLSIFLDKIGKVGASEYMNTILNANDDAKTLVAAWISGGTLGTGIDKIDFSDPSWNFNSIDGMNKFFDQLNGDGFTWKSIGSNKQHNVDYLTDSTYFDLVKTTINNNINLQTSDSLMLVNLLDGSWNFGEYKQQIKDFLNKNLPDYSALIITGLIGLGWKLPDSLFPLLSPYLIGPDGDGGIVNILDELDSKLNGMFAIPFDLSTWKGWMDLVMPWAETTLFLGVSIKFFKWS